MSAPDDPKLRPTRQFAAVQGGGEHKPFRTDPEWIALQAEAASRNSHAALNACDGLADNYDSLRKLYDKQNLQLEEFGTKIDANTKAIERVDLTLKELKDAIVATQTMATRAETTAVIAEKTARESLSEEDDVEAELAQIALADRKLSLKAKELQLGREEQDDLEKKRRADTRWLIFGKFVGKVVVPVITAAGVIIALWLTTQTKQCTADAAEMKVLVNEGGGGHGGGQ